MDLDCADLKPDKKAVPSALQGFKELLEALIATGEKINFGKQ